MEQDVLGVIPASALDAIVNRVEPSSTVIAADVILAGLSSWMTLVEVARRDGSRHRLVVRRGRHPDAERDTLPFGKEFALLRHLHDRGVPVPRARGFDDTGAILSQSYLVLDFVEGATCFASDDPVAVGVRMADVLAAIHDVDPVDPALPDLPCQLDRTEDWVINDLRRREPDESLREDLVRRHLDRHWPPKSTESCLLHGDYFPGNIVWDGDDIVAVIDWETAATGDPMADVATTRLDLRWILGSPASDAFTDRYLATSGRSAATLPVWDLVAALRPAGAISLWATDMAAHGRPDMSAASMRAEHHAHVDGVIARLADQPAEA
jgi:aminoglycoside phosphotransferase (APT) family kinase protein